MKWTRAIRESPSNLLKHATDIIENDGPRSFSQMWSLFPMLFSPVDRQTKDKIIKRFYKMVRDIQPCFIKDAESFVHHIDLSTTSPPQATRLSKRMKGQLVLFTLFLLATITVLLGYDQGKRVCQRQARLVRYKRQQLYRYPFPPIVEQMLNEAYQETLSNCLLNEQMTFVFQSTPENFHLLGFVLLIITVLLGGEAFVMQRHVLAEYIGETKTRLVITAMAVGAMYKTKLYTEANFPQYYNYLIQSIGYAKNIAITTSFFMIRNMTVNQIFDIIFKMGIGTIGLISGPIAGYRLLLPPPPRAN